MRTNLLVLDAAKLNRERGFGKFEIAERADGSWRSAHRALSGEAIGVFVARKVAKALGFRLRDVVVSVPELDDLDASESPVAEAGGLPAM